MKVNEYGEREQSKGEIELHELLDELDGEGLIVSGRMPQNSKDRRLKRYHELVFHIVHSPPASGGVHLTAGHISNRLFLLKRLREGGAITIRTYRAYSFDELPGKVTTHWGDTSEREGFSK